MKAGAGENENKSPDQYTESVIIFVEDVIHLQKLRKSTKCAENMVRSNPTHWKKLMNNILKDGLLAMDSEMSEKGSEKISLPQA